MCYILANMAYHTGDLISLQFFFLIFTQWDVVFNFSICIILTIIITIEKQFGIHCSNIPTFTFACRHNGPHSVFSENESKTTLYVMTLAANLAEGIERSLNDLFLFYKSLIIVDN